MRSKDDRVVTRSRQLEVSDERQCASWQAYFRQTG